MLTPKIVDTISAYLCSCSCQYCYHIRKKYCILFSPKALCDTQKLLKRRLRPELRPGPCLGSSQRSAQPHSAGEGYPFQSPPSSMHFSSQIDIGAIVTFDASFNEPRQWLRSCVFWRSTVDAFQGPALPLPHNFRLEPPLFILNMQTRRHS